MANAPKEIYFDLNAWHTGTLTLSRKEKGAYMDLLVAQLNCGHLSLYQIKTVLGADYGSIWPSIQKKFKTDIDGLYHNERLMREITRAKEEVEEEKAFSEKQRQRAKKSRGSATASASNTTISTNTNSLDNRRILFIDEVMKYSGEYEGKMLGDFIDYWAESNGKKMLWEMHKTFEIPRRLNKWKSNQEKWASEKKEKSGDKVELSDKARQEAVQATLKKVNESIG